MRIAVKSTGGITESFLYVDNVEEGVREAAKLIAEDYGLPTDIELWSNGPGRRPAPAPRPVPLRRRHPGGRRRRPRMTPPARGTACR